MRYVVVVNGQEHEVTIDGPAVRAEGVEEEAHVVDLEGIPVRVIMLGHRIYRVLARRESAVGRYSIRLEGFRLDVEALDERTRRIPQVAGGAAAKAGPGPLVAPMPGLIVRVLAQPGDSVAAGQGLVVMEAMKMENELRVARPGVVKAVRVAAGDAVEKGTILIELE